MGKAYCETCNKEFEHYELTTEKYTHEINGVTYEFDEYVVHCPICGDYMCVNGLIDKNVEWMIEQYKEKGGKGIGKQ